jgi:hypothetical protein
LQWLQDASEINRDNLNNVRRETSRHFRNKEAIYERQKLMSLQQTAKTRTIETCIEE